MHNKMIAAVLVLLLTSCTTTNSGGGAGTATVDAAQPRPKVDASAPLATSAADLAKSSAEETETSEPTVYRGNNRQVKMPAVEEPIRFLGEDVSINFEQAPLSEVMHAIMGDISAAGLCGRPAYQGRGNAAYPHSHTPW